jgi:hypothetical protein
LIPPDRIRAAVETGRRDGNQETLPAGGARIPQGVEQPAVALRVQFVKQDRGSVDTLRPEVVAGEYGIPRVALPVNDRIPTLDDLQVFREERRRLRQREAFPRDDARLEAIRRRGIDFGAGFAVRE